MTEVVVTRADREAAVAFARWFGWGSDSCTAIEEGLDDEVYLVRAFARHAAAARVEGARAMQEAAGLMDALAKVMPARVQDGPDYAQVYFGDGSAHSTQAMTMNPQDWRDLQAAYEAIRSLDTEGRG